MRPPDKKAPEGQPFRAENSHGEVTGVSALTVPDHDSKVKEQLLCEYRRLKPLESLLERSFWAIQSRRNWIADELARRDVPPFCQPSGRKP